MRKYWHRRWILVGGGVVLLMVMVACSTRWVEQATVSEQDQQVKWVKSNARSVQPPDVQDDRDLEFLKPLLREKRIVWLGENILNSRESQQTSIRLIKYLHEKMGYDVLVMDSGLGEVGLAYANMDQITTQSVMNVSVSASVRTQDMLRLFEYATEQAKTRNPLVLCGITTHPSGGFPALLDRWFSEIDPQMGKKARDVEKKYLTDYTPAQYQADQREFEQGYTDLLAFMNEYSAELQAVYRATPETWQVVERALQDHLYTATVLLSSESFYRAGPSEQSLRIAANNLTWLAQQVYAGRKMIVLSYSHNVQKQRSAVETSYGQGMKSLLERLPDRLKDESYSIGVYAGQGQGLGGDDKIFTIESKHVPGSLEWYLKQLDAHYAFLDLSQQKQTSDNAWIYQPIRSMSFGAIPERMIAHDVYDGLLYIKEVHPSMKVNSNE